MCTRRQPENCMVKKFIVENPWRLKDTQTERRKKLMREKSIKRLFMIWYGSVLSDIPREIYIQWREYVTREQDTRMPSWGRAKYVWLIIQKRLTLRSQRKILVELCSILWIRFLFVYIYVGWLGIVDSTSMLIYKLDVFWAMWFIMLLV